MAFTRLVQPSYHQGYAHERGQSAFPELWDGLIGAWVLALGATGDIVKDVSGRGQDGTFGNFNENNWIIGDNSRGRGYVYDFNGSSENINITPFTSDGVTSHTFIMWVKRIDQDYIFDSDGDRLIIDFGTNATANNLSFFDGAWKSLGLVPANENHHVALSLDANGGAIGYLDGLVLGTNTYTPGPISGQVRIASQATSAAPFYQGQLADFRIYNGILTAETIFVDSQHYLAPFQLRRRTISRVAAAVAALPLGTLALTGVGR